MKFSIDKAELSSAVDFALSFVASKSSIPQLEGIKFVVKDGKLTLTGYNLEVGGAVSIPVNQIYSEDGEAVLPARMLNDILKKVKGDDVSVEIDGNYVGTMVCKRSKFKLSCLTADQYPALPEVSADGFEIPGEDLKSLLETVFATADSTATTPVFTGVNLALEGGKLTAAAIDGYRLAVKVWTGDATGESKATIPAAAAKALRRVLPASAKVAVKFGEKHALFRFDDQMIVCRVLDGKFADWSRFIPADFKTIAVLDTDEAKSALDCACLVVTGAEKAPVKMEVDSKSVHFSVRTANNSSCEELDALEVSGTAANEPMVIGFNGRYLKDALSAIKSESVEIRLNGPLSAIIVVPKNSDDTKSEDVFLVQPVRLN